MSGGNRPGTVFNYKPDPLGKNRFNTRIYYGILTPVVAPGSKLREGAAVKVLP
jgi:hypothetical protein